MKAILADRYGSPDVLRFEEVEVPQPGDDEVLIKVCAASVNPFDWHSIRGTPYAIRLMTGLRKPRRARLGVDAAGRVEAVGRNVSRFRPGDEVFGSFRGSFAEYACTRQAAVAAKPRNATFAQAAAVPVAAFTALQALRDKGRLQAGQQVLINGAAGGVGTFAVQIAKAHGAEVTGVCSTSNVEMVRSIGADHVVDYTREDFTQAGERYDLLLDCIGNHPVSARKRVLKPNGACLLVGGSRLIQGVLSSWFSRKVRLVAARAKQADLDTLRDLIEAGKVMPVIDRQYSLHEVPQAIRHVAEGHTRGKVVITVA